MTSGRVLNAKHSTATRAASAQSSHQLWDRVARAAASSPAPGSAPAPRAGAPTANAFPPLQGPSNGAAGSSSSFRQPQRTTPWASSGAGAGASAPSPAPVVRAPTSVPGPGARTKGGPAVFSKSAFPELPTSSTARLPKAAISGNQSLRNILGASAPAAPAWGGESGGSGSNTPAAGEQGAGGDGDGAGAGAGGGGGGGSGKKKGKGKQKQTLFTLGTFPA